MEIILALFKSIEAAKVIAPEINYSEYIPLNLSITNSELKLQKLETAQDYEIFIQNHLNKNEGKIAFGGYIETRNLYKRSTVFKNENTDERNIHIGLDLWINEAATIHAALAGKIHSFQNNTALGDYGPTIILEHEIEGFVFHTLYGHLSEASLLGKKVGDIVTKGEQIATLGLPPINGDYAPHLHFQIIIDMEGKTGDYPGVCSEKTLDFYKNNCPNPNLLLKIN
ncbi:MAG: peptidoglycan DD-metalloendopeptidase family protein [Flavobacterium sp.]|jgi:murein DD-endopeptidase MepM/ murein hydrolase activator NlpD|nr:peptidoglycan DD-metalloendopeptidase family protein [Flavobacterium sp.]